MMASDGTPVAEISANDEFSSIFQRVPGSSSGWHCPLPEVLLYSSDGSSEAETFTDIARYGGSRG